MRILLTGDRGFIGSHLAPELRANGHAVVGHDCAEGDLSEPGVFATALRAANPDMVVHLAAQYGKALCEDHLAHAIRSNVTMTTLIAQACGQRGVPLTFTSTSEVYGDRGEEICRESTPLIAPATGIYALTKRWAEESCRHYAPEGLRIIRPNMPYGPGILPRRGKAALVNFLWSAHRGESIYVHRGAERSWIYIDDAVRGMRMVIEGPEGTYNVGRKDDRRTMLEVACVACDLTGASHSLIEEVEAPINQTVVKRLAFDRVQQLGWEPTIPLEDGMRDTLSWLMAQEDQLAWERAVAC